MTSPSKVSILESMPKLEEEEEELPTGAKRSILEDMPAIEEDPRVAESVAGVEIGARIPPLGTLDLPSGPGDLTPMLKRWETLLESSRDLPEVEQPPEFLAGLARRYGPRVGEAIVKDFPREWRAPMVRGMWEGLPSPREAQLLIENKKWRKVGELALEGMFPTAGEMGEDWLSLRIIELSKGDSRDQAAAKLLLKATYDPLSSKERKVLAAGEIPEFHLVSQEFVDKHPLLAVLPLAITSPVEDVAYDVMHPEAWPGIAVMALAGHYVFAPATKAGFAWLKKQGWATRPMGELFQRRTKIPWEQIKDISSREAGRKMGPVPAHVQSYWDDLPGDVRATIARKAKAKGFVRLVIPKKFKGIPVEQVPTSAASVDPIIRDADPSAVRGMLGLRGTVDVTDDALVEQLGSALGKKPEMATAVSKHGADAVLSQIGMNVSETPVPVTPMSEWMQQEGAKLLARMSEEEQKGFFRSIVGYRTKTGKVVPQAPLPPVGFTTPVPGPPAGPPQPRVVAPRAAGPPPPAGAPPGAPPPVAPPPAAPPPIPPEVQDPELKAALYAGRQHTSRVQAVGNWVKDKSVELKDFATAEFEPELLRKGYIQFRDDYRTGALPIPLRAREHAEMAFGNVWGTLNKKDKDTVLNLMGMRTFIQSAGEGIEIPRNLDPPMIENEYNRMAAQAQQYNPEILEALDRYQEYARLVGEELVNRGKMAPDALKEFYLPHLIVDYLPDWYTNAPFIPRRVKQPFRPYTKERAGSVKDIAISEQTLYTHFATVNADNMMDDWATGQLERYDVLPNMPRDQRLAVFGESRNPRPNRVYDIGGVPHKGFQYLPGNMMYRAEMANPLLLFHALEDALLTDTAEVNRIFRLPPDQQYAEVMKFLEDVGPRGANALRTGRAIGRYNRVYVIPEPIHDKLARFKDPGVAAPFIYDLMNVTRFWKRLALSPIGAGLPFHMANFMGDSQNAFRTAPGSLKHIPDAVNILYKMHPGRRQMLSAFEADVLRIVEEKDVLGSGFTREYATVTPISSAKGLWKKFERMGALREATLRIAMTAHQLQRYRAGQGLHAPEFKHIIKDLDPESGIGHIARNFGVDYLAIPDFYRRYVRGVGLPFATFWQKSGHNWALYTKNAPARYVAKVIAPVAAAWTWNNTVMKDVEDRLGYFRQRTFHLNLRKIDDDEDGQPDRAIIWAPQLPHDMAMQFTGIHLIPDKITMIRKGMMTPEEAAKQQLVDMGMATPELAQNLLNPLIQAFIGMKTNRDPFSKKAIVPEELKNIPDDQKLRYWIPYVIEKFITPFGQYMRNSPREKVFGLIPKPKEIIGDLARYAQEGPLDIWRGMGLYEINLHAADARMTMDISRDARSKWAKAMYEIETSYLDSDQDDAAFFAGKRMQSVLQNAARQDIIVDDEQIGSRIYSPRVQIQKVQRQILYATDTKRKRELEKTLNELLKFRALEYASKTPIGGFVPMVKKLIKVGEK